jgi:hypothetical protein
MINYLAPRALEPAGVNGPGPSDCPVPDNGLFVSGDFRPGRGDRSGKGALFSNDALSVVHPAIASVSTQRIAEKQFLNGAGIMMWKRRTRIPIAEAQWLPTTPVPLPPPLPLLPIPAPPTESDRESVPYVLPSVAAPAPGAVEVSEPKVSVQAAAPKVNANAQRNRTSFDFMLLIRLGSNLRVQAMCRAIDSRLDILYRFGSTQLKSATFGIPPGS